MPEPGRVRSYSFIRHLAQAMWFDHDPRRCLIAVFTAYYDASGSQSDPHGRLLVLGMVSTEKKWIRFEKEWRKVLKDFGVPYFHMKEFGPGIGPFRLWRADVDKRSEFLKELIRVVKRNINKSFSNSIDISDYRDVDRLYRFRETFGGPYSFCAGVCLNTICRWVTKKYPHHQRLLHVFERGDAGQGEFMRFARKHEQVEPQIKSKIDPATGEWFVPFQAADLMAWEYRRGIDTYLKDEGRLRESLRAILKGLPSSGRLQTKAHLLAFCEWRKVPRRS